MTDQKRGAIVMPIFLGAVLMLIVMPALMIGLEKDVQAQRITGGVVMLASFKHIETAITTVGKLWPAHT